MIDQHGDLIALATGLAAPGMRVPEGMRVVNGGYFSGLQASAGALPIETIPELAGNSPSRILVDLFNSGEFTPLLEEFQPLTYYYLSAKATRDTLKTGELESGVQFTKSIPMVSIVASWQPLNKIKNTQFMLSAAVYDAENKVRVRVAPGKMKLTLNNLTRTLIQFPTEPLTPGIYRVDLLVDNAAVWRSYLDLKP